MNKEISAGGIIACLVQKSWYVLVMKDMHAQWTFPKGKIESDEGLADTAKREIEEEVGITGLKQVAALSPVSYWYFRKKPIRKIVHYFLFLSKTRQKPVVQTEEGITEAKWVSWQDAMDMIGYPKTNRPMLREARELLP